ncbi:MAG TPA: hypothetical protein VFA66_15055 [Gaiellaceae bacterium]|nr:hypothetical protein [Gaiellaceae bacterium]
MFGRPVLVLFSGVAGSPFIAGIVSGRLDRGELDPRLQEVLLRGDDAKVETLSFMLARGRADLCSGRTSSSAASGRAKSSWLCNSATAW